MTDLGPTPELAWLPVKHLTVDLSYQRTLETRGSQRLIEKIAAEFSWARFQTILTTPDGKGFWLIIDGQHRAEAARRRRIEHIPAVVVAGLDARDQAAAFVGANRDRRQVSAQEMFHARLAAGDAAAEAITRICKAAGISVLRYSIGADFAPIGTTQATAALLYALDKHGEANTTAAVVAIARIASDVRGGLRGEFFLGVSLWLNGGGPARRAGCQDRPHRRCGWVASCDYRGNRRTSDQGDARRVCSFSRRHRTASSRRHRPRPANGWAVSAA
jgi:hypothetical protein